MFAVDDKCSYRQGKPGKSGKCTPPSGFVSPPCPNVFKLRKIQLPFCMLIGKNAFNCIAINRLSYNKVDAIYFTYPTGSSHNAGFNLAIQSQMHQTRKLTILANLLFEKIAKLKCNRIIRIILTVGQVSLQLKFTLFYAQIMIIANHNYYLHVIYRLRVNTLITQ